MSTSTPLAKRILWGLVIGVVAAVATLGIGQWHPPTLALMQKISAAVAKARSGRARRSSKIPA